MAAEGERPTYLRRLVKQAFRLGLLVLLVLTPIACGGGAGRQEATKRRPTLAPYRRTTRPCPRRIPLGGVRALALVQGRRGLGARGAGAARQVGHLAGGEGGDPLLIFRNLRQVFKLAKSTDTPPAV